MYFMQIGRFSNLRILKRESNICKYSDIIIVLPFHSISSIVYAMRVIIFTLEHIRHKTSILPHTFVLKHEYIHLQIYNKSILNIFAY